MSKVYDDTLAYLSRTLCKGTDCPEYDYAVIYDIACAIHIDRAKEIMRDQELMNRLGLWIETSILPAKKLALVLWPDIKDPQAIAIKTGVAQRAIEAGYHLPEDCEKHNV